MKLLIISSILGLILLIIGLAYMLGNQWLENLFAEWEDYWNENQPEHTPDEHEERVYNHTKG